MEWLNENVGFVVLISAILIIVLIGFVIGAVFMLHRRLAVQRLYFLGMQSLDTETRARYASITVGNRSLNDVAIAELGVLNGKVSFNLTELYRQKNSLTENARIAVEQRSSLCFQLTEEELKKLFLLGKNGKRVLKRIRVYAVDSTGNLYRKSVPNVRKLLVELNRSSQNA